ncbi:MAG: hypothetical protein ACRET6_13535 [Burkholderiales bacterium]
MLGSKDLGRPDDPLAEAAKQAARLRGLDPLAALNELSEWLDAVKGSSGGEEKVRGEILSLIQEASGTHVSALLAQFLAPRKDKQATHESDWDTLGDFLRVLAGALCASSRILLNQSTTTPALQLPAAAGVARGLHAARTLAKIYLLRYFSVPPKLWRLAYAVHGDAEKAGCATTPVRLHAAQHTTTTVTQELLRMLMLQSSSPDMMPPEQIEAADRVIEQVGGDFTLRPRGAHDSPFCFDPGSDRPPHRAPAQPPGPDSGIRYFGAGAGYDALDRLHKQLAATRTADSKAPGKDISLDVQDLAIQHLAAFWGKAAPYSPPARKPAAGTLQVVQGYGQVWQHLSHSGSGSKELSLVDEGASAATQAPETWTLHDAGGNELGVEVPLRSRNRARCGGVVSATMQGSSECWLGTIRSLHAEPGRSLHANIQIMSRHPQALQLRAVIAKGEEGAVSESASRQFDFSGVRAIIVSDGAEGPQKANFMLAPDNWKEGRAYEATIGGATRFLRSQQLLRHGDDYVRATFEWVQQA